MPFDNEKPRRDQGAFHRPTGIVIPLEELRPLTAAVGESANTNNELIIVSSSGNAQDNHNGGNETEGFNNEKSNISYTAKKNFSQGMKDYWLITWNYSWLYLNILRILQGMMDIALLTANASQLRYVMRSQYWDFHHKMNIALICISIALQVYDIQNVAFIFADNFGFNFTKYLL